MVSILEETLIEDLTPELTAKYDEFAEKYLDKDGHNEIGVFLGEKIWEAYNETKTFVEGLHEGANYAEDFDKESFKKAKRLFERNSSDYVHNREQAREVVSNYLIQVLRSIDTGTSNQIVQRYESTQDERTEEERFEFLKESFHNLFGINPRTQRGYNMQIDLLVQNMATEHRAKALLQQFGQQWKAVYSGALMSRKFKEVVSDAEMPAYEKYVTAKLAEIDKEPRAGQVAFYDRNQWLDTHFKLVNDPNEISFDD